MEVWSGATFAPAEQFRDKQCTTRKNTYSIFGNQTIITRRIVKTILLPSIDLELVLD